MKRYRRKMLSALWVAAFLLPGLPARGDEAADTASSFSAQELIFGHLTDKYEWELPFSNRRIYLPVLVRDHRGEWHLFSSRRLADGASHRGFYIAPDGANRHKIESVDEAGNRYRPFDLSLTKNALALLITAGILGGLVCWLAGWYRRHPYKAPRKGLGALEFVVAMLYDEVIVPVLGRDARRFGPYLLTLFFFILTANLLGIVAFFPGGANLTGNISVTLVLALCTFLVVNFSGTRHYWKEVFWPDVPGWLKAPVPLMPLIEFFGVITKPVALMIRLFANMLGGHLITLVLISLIFIFGAMGAAVQGTTSVFSVAFAFFMGLIDLLICFIQAYVFMMLSALFIALARVEPEEKKPK